MNTFYIDDIVKHKKGRVYKIKNVPVHYKRLEYCDEEYYEYEDCVTGIVWIRRKSQMEDGRFIINE